MSDPVAAARTAFDAYAGMGAAELPAATLSALQVRLARWQSRNFGPGQSTHLALGVCEEAGELAHAVLKAEQGIRGMDDREKARAAVGDAIADVAIYAIQMATLYRLDFWTLVVAVAEVVMAREWAKDPVGAGGVASQDVTP